MVQKLDSEPSLYVIFHAVLSNALLTEIGERILEVASLSPDNLITEAKVQSQAVDKGLGSLTILRFTMRNLVMMPTFLFKTLIVVRCFRSQRCWRKFNGLNFVS